MSRVHTLGYPRPYLAYKLVVIRPAVISEGKLVHDAKTFYLRYPKFYLGGKRDKFFRFHRLRADAPRRFSAVTREHEGELRTAHSKILRVGRYGLEYGRWQDSHLDLHTIGTESTGWVDDEQRHLARALRASFGVSELDDDDKHAGDPSFITALNSGIVRDINASL